MRPVVGSKAAVSTLTPIFALATKCPSRESQRPSARFRPPMKTLGGRSQEVVGHQLSTLD